jgi:hypothetical protein
MMRHTYSPTGMEVMYIPYIPYLSYRAQLTYQMEKIVTRHMYCRYVGSLGGWVACVPARGGYSVKACGPISTVATLPELEGPCAVLVEAWLACDQYARMCVMRVGCGW